ncbi:hypothetical protein SKAU_G00401450 [Synaphobranchus kaupii]|uniref:Uncharacterized protein n=1 Tax=Synaphobranchus kaupii TaxID=118154 RepID=A0A9Q1E970_SYNKA|nr:hypothetical protein SKAU_G00401450 [Synaphobranchus kaupii]
MAVGELESVEANGEKTALTRNCQAASAVNCSVGVTEPGDPEIFCGAFTGGERSPPPPPPRP